MVSALRALSAGVCVITESGHQADRVGLSQNQGIKLLLKLCIVRFKSIDRTIFVELIKF
jgi:hypothetical protein